MFVQVEEAEIERLEAEPDSVEALFAEGPPAGAARNLTAAMQERLRSITPEAMAQALSRMPEPLRQQLEASMGRTAAAMSSGKGADALFQLIEKRLAQRAAPAGKRETLFLEKAWHGLHYLLTGSAEPGKDLRSQVVMGGTEIGDDPEGFSGYGPARYFRAAEVRKISEELGKPEMEREVLARYDPALMSRLQIYPGWQSGEEDREWLMDAFRRLRDFYAGAAAQGRAIVTCLV